jgi:hypothetical protein
METSMKTPRFLLAALLLAAPAAQAEPKAGQRCDTEWLEAKVASLSQPGHTVSDERVETVGDTLKLKFKHAKTCDAATWRHLATEEPNNGGDLVLDPKTHQPVGGTSLRWRTKAAGDYWAQTAVADHMKLLLVLDDYYKRIDARAAEVAAAGDEVLDAAKALGLADYTVSDKTLAESLYGTSGGATGAMKPRVATVLAAGAQKPASVGPNDVGPTYRKLVAGIAEPYTEGPAILRFRKAVLALGQELQALSIADANVKRRIQGGKEGLKDSLLALPDGFIALKPEDTNATDPKKYGAALAALVGEGSGSGLADASVRAKSALDPVDVGLRNLIIARNAEVDKILAATQARLKGKTMAMIESGSRMAGRTADAKLEGTLAAATMRQLAASGDYANLDAMFEARKAKPDGAEWVKSAAGQKAAAELEAMRAAAQSTKVETVDGKTVISVMVNGEKKVFKNVPANVATDQGAVDYTADQIADLILRGSKETGKYQGALDALGGKVPADQRPAGGLEGSLPDAPAAPKSAWEQAKNGPQAGCGSPSDLGKSDMERIAARKAEAAGDAASDNSKLRGKLQKELNESDDKIRKECAANPNPDETEAVRTANCNKRIAAAREAIIAKPAYASVLDSGTEGARKADAIAQGDKEISDLYDSGITDALVSLEAAYSKEGDAHRLDLERATGYKGENFDPKRVKRYFDEAWRKGDAAAAERYAACRKVFGYEPGKALAGAKLQNPRADREVEVENSKGVNQDCKVRAELVTFFNSFHNQVDAPAGAGDEVPAKLDADEVLRRRRAAKKP